MTSVYFIRHAESDFTVRDDRSRPLTAKGFSDRGLVTGFLSGKGVRALLSSPYKRAVDTVGGFAAEYGFEIELVEDFRERETGDIWIEDWKAFSIRQWADFSYKPPGGESMKEAQTRNIAALDGVLAKYRDETIAIGTHGTALSLIINHYDRTYGFEDFWSMSRLMPWAVRMDFNEDGCVGVVKTDLFDPDREADYENCTVRTYDAGELKAYRFVVVFARRRGKWLYCRAKARDSFETAGGRIEPGESPLEAAKRELYEETGATGFDIEPAFDYTVHIPSAYSNGKVFLAHIHELGNMPDYEMAEVRLFDAAPEKMRFPKILPVLYERIKALIT